MGNLISKWLNAAVPFLFVIVFSFGMQLDGYVDVIIFLAAIGVLTFLSFYIKYLNERIRKVNPRSNEFTISAVIGLFLLPFLQLSWPYAIYVETYIFVLVITLLSFSITLGLTGLVDIGIGAYMGIGAYVSARLSIDFGIPVYITPFLGAAVSAIFAKILGFIVLRVRGHYFSLFSLGLGVVAYHLFIQFKSFTLGTDGIPNIPALDLFGVSATQSLRIFGYSFPYQMVSYYWLLIMFLLVLFFVLKIETGHLGRCLKATKDNEDAAVSSGINIFKHRSWAYTIGGAIAGLAGGLFAHTTNYIAPRDFGLQESVFYLTLAILGGFGKPFHCISAAFAIVFLEEKLREIGDYRLMALAIAILIIVLNRAKFSQKLREFLETK